MACVPGFGKRLQENAEALFKKGVEAGGGLTQALGGETVFAFQGLKRVDNGTEARGAQGGGVALASGHLRCVVEPCCLAGSDLCRWCGGPAGQDVPPVRTGQAADAMDIMQATMTSTIMQRIALAPLLGCVGKSRSVGPTTSNSRQNITRASLRVSTLFQVCEQRRASAWSLHQRLCVTHPRHTNKVRSRRTMMLCNNALSSAACLIVHAAHHLHVHSCCLT